MKITSVTVGSATVSDWIPMDSYRLPFTASAAVTVTETVSLTYSVQVTYDDLSLKTPIALSRTTTTVTGTLANHGLAVGDSIRIENAGAPMDGVFAIASVADANTFTYTVANSGATTNTLGATITIMRVFSPTAFASKTAKVDGAISAPVSAVRLAVTTYSSGKATLTVLQGG